MSWILNEEGLSYNNRWVEGEYSSFVNKVSLKTSSNGVYAAVCNIHSFYVDVYIVKKADDGKECPTYLYSLRRNTYKTKDTDFLFEFFTSPSEPSKTLFIFNLNHGVISVCDAHTGQEVHTDYQDDKFITSYKIIEEYKQQYLYIEGWYWASKFFTALYDINHLLTTPLYKGIILDTDVQNVKSDYHIRMKDDEDRIQILPTIHPFNTFYDVKDFVTNHKSIKDFAECVKSTEQLINTIDNLAHRLCDSESQNNDLMFVGNARSKLLAIITKPLDAHFDDLITLKCIDYTGTFKDTSTITKCLATSFPYDDKSFKYLIPRLLSNGFVRFNMSEIALVLTIQRQSTKVKININQKLKRVAGEQHIYEVDPNEPCAIHIE